MTLPVVARAAAPLPNGSAMARVARGAPKVWVVLLLAILPSASGAQRAEPVVSGPRPAPVRDARAEHYWRGIATGFAASLLAHESAHVLTALAVGAHPTFGLSRGRPTVYSGINAETDPHRQFLFSSMGLNTQALLDEAVLDLPRARGTPVERGVLLGGIATALFYVTVGRTASVSDIDFMARTSSLTKTQLTMLYGGVALLHAVRVSRDGQYAEFFIRPAADGYQGPRSSGRAGLRVGVSVAPDARP